MWSPQKAFLREITRLNSVREQCLSTCVSLFWTVFSHLLIMCPPVFPFITFVTRSHLFTYFLLSWTTSFSRMDDHLSTLRIPKLTQHLVLSTQIVGKWLEQMDEWNWTRLMLSERKCSAGRWRELGERVLRVQGNSRLAWGQAEGWMAHRLQETA